MNNIEFKIFTLAPSKNITPQIVYDHFSWRKTHRYTGANTIQFGDVQEPIWWNRPLKSNQVIKKEADGLYSYNLPYMHEIMFFKSNYNLLVGKGTVPLIAHIKVNPNWNSSQKALMHDFVKKAIYNTLIKLGVDATKLTKPSNDILYDGKKFMGFEGAEHGGWYGAAAVITLNYSNEAEIFKRLTGEYALKRSICGIQEETGNKFTKEQFINTLIEEFKTLLKAL